MIEIINITKVFKSITALAEISCVINDGEFVSFLGPSGSGKSTLLNIIAGIMSPTSGKVIFDGLDATSLNPRDRSVGFVFQNYALYPSMTVRKNVEFPLESLKIKAKDRDKLVSDIAEKVKIKHIMDKRPHELSGGEQQRVAIARALVKRPKILLLDEPFSNLDPRLSTEMRDEIKKLQQQLKITSIMVTHNQAEAMELSDRIALLSLGKLIQFDCTEKVYCEPHNLFCAQFLGDVRINVVHGIMKNGGFYNDKGEYMLDIECDIEETVIMCFRPEDVSVNQENYGEDNYYFKVTVISSFNRGREFIIGATFGDDEIKFFVPSKFSPIPLVGQKINISLNKKKILFFNAENGNRIMVKKA